MAGRPPDGVAMVFQHFGLLPWKTVYDNAAFGLAMAGVPRAQDQGAGRRIISNSSGSPASRTHYPYQLSGGMQQRVGLVRALAMNPSILLMDEPFAALDAQTREVLQEELLALMQRPDERKTMVFITHSIDEAIVLGDRIAVMSARPGRIKEVLDMPFGWPRDVDAVRSDPRFAEIRLHIWRQLHSAQAAADAGAEGGRVTTIDQTRGDLADAASRATCPTIRRAPSGSPASRRHRRQALNLAIRLRLARDRADAVGGGGAERRPDPVHHAERRSRSPRVEMIRSGELWTYLWPSLVVLAHRLCARGGVRHRASGSCWRAIWVLDVALSVYITFLYSIPSVALVPLIVLWAGFETTAKVIILFLFAFFPMVINTYQGVKGVDPKLLEVGRAFRCSEWQLWSNIVLPAALPFIVTGLRLALGRGLIGMVLADLYTAISGIGYLIVRTACDLPGRQDVRADRDARAARRDAHGAAAAGREIRGALDRGVARGLSRWTRSSRPMRRTGADEQQQRQVL